MEIPAGPSTIADVYKGNPGALQANIQKEQQQKPSITPDFAKLLALGTVTSDRDNAAKAQALQQLQGLVAQSPMGKPPTIFQQLQAKAAQMAAMRGPQAQPQAQPQGLPAALQGEEPVQTAAHGGLMRGIDQIPSNLQMAGGGIVAFPTGGKVDDPEEQSQFVRDINALGRYLTPFSAEHIARTRAEDAAKAAAEKARAEQRAAQIEAGRSRSLASYLSNYFTTPKSQMQAAESYLPAAPEAPTEQDVIQAAQNVRTPTSGAATANLNTLETAAPAAAPKPAPVKDIKQLAQQKQQQPVQPAAPAAEPSAHAYLMEHVRRTLDQNPEALGEAAAARNRKMLGLDELLAEKNKRIAEREAMQQAQQAGRLPLWVSQAAAFSRANPRAGLGAQLGVSGTEAEKVRAGYEEQDLAFNAEINKLKDAVLQARIEGRYKDAAAYEAELNRIRQEKATALTSGASLENAAEARKSREQTARLAATAAAERAKERREEKETAAADKREQEQRNLALKQATAAAKAAMALPQNMAKYRNMSEEELALQMFPRFLAALKGDKMTEAPGAAGPGGTTRMRFDAQGNPIK